MSVIRSTERRRIETPNGTMSTLATPTQGETRDLAVWHVEFRADRIGPLHVIDRETVWTVLTGGLVLDVDGEKTELAPGDTVVIPADRPRQMTSAQGFTAVVCSTAGPIVYNPAGHVPVDPCDLAPKTDQRIPVPWAV